MDDSYGPPHAWTAYPSLLPSLSKNHQDALEEAACADCCGRFRDADGIFEHRLPPSHTVPIVALQHADMLSSSGREHPRIEVLESALASLSTADETENPCLRILMEIMLVEARFFALGLAPAREITNALSSLRQRLRNRNLDSLSCIELRCFTAYYELVNVLELHTNFINRSDKTIFEDDIGNKFFDSKLDEIRALMNVLQRQQRWRSAPTMTQLLLKHSSGEETRDAVIAAFSLSATLESQSHPGIRYRAVVLKRSVADILDDVLPHMAAPLRQEAIAILGQLSAPFSLSWQVFCPLVDANFQKKEACSQDLPHMEKLHRLEALAEAAINRSDLLLATQIHITIHDEVKKWLNGIKDDDASQQQVLDIYRQTQADFANFHREQTRSLYFYAAALVNQISILYLRQHLCSEMIKLIDAFLDSYPDFSIPHFLEAFYRLGATGARTLEMNDKVEFYLAKQLEWEAQCPFTERRSADALERLVLDPDSALRHIYGNSQDTMSWGYNSIHLMLLWAAHEWESSLLTTEDILNLFGPGLGSIPRGNAGIYLRGFSSERLADYIFGTPEDVRDTSLFLAQYRELLQWILIPDRLPNRAIRITALIIFLQARISRLSDFITNSGYATDRHRSNLMTEYLELDQLQVLQAGANQDTGVDHETQAVSASIRATLLRSYLDNSVEKNLIADEELQAQIVRCRELVTRCHNRGHGMFEYLAVTQLIRLMWQRHFHFKQPLDDLLPVAEEADRVFTRLRNDIMIRDPSADLVAKAKLSKDFEYREHYSYALMTTLTVMDMRLEIFKTLPQGSTEQDQLQVKVLSSYMDFLSWAVHSKGPGFADILNLEAGVAQSVSQQDEAAYEPFRKLTAAGNEDGNSRDPGPPYLEKSNPFGGRMATPTQIVEMLSQLPDNIVIIDFVNMKYSISNNVTIAAVIYKKGRSALIYKMPDVRVEGIAKWVNLYVDEPQRNRRAPLSGQDSMQALGNLNVMLNQLAGSSGLIPAGDTVIICPTGCLNRVPFHAMPVGEGDVKVPFIERNPVVYCQSLTVLHWLWQRFRESSKERRDDKPRVTVVNPMPDTWETTGDAVFSKEFNEGLARQLKAENNFWHGFGLHDADVKEAIESSSLLHYHGHIEYNPISALDSIMVLNKAAFDNPFQRIRSDTDPRELITGRDFFNLKLRAPALATIIGCASGATMVSNTDDVLGFPTALFYAGAGAVISTLWPIRDEDGADFAKGLYAAISRQQSKIKKPSPTAVNPTSSSLENVFSYLRLATSCFCGSGSTEEEERPLLGTESESEREREAAEPTGFLDSTIDMAAAMQEALVGLMKDSTTGELRPAHHWAGFTVNGFWLLPSNAIPEMNGAQGQ